MRNLLLLATIALTACAAVRSPESTAKLRDFRSASGERVLSGDDPGDRTVAVSTVGIGPSVPESDPVHNIAPGKMVHLFRESGVSRISGGERFVFTLVDSKQKPYIDQLVAIRLVGYSKSGKGHLLVRDVQSSPALPPGFLAPLYRFASVAPGSKVGQHGDSVLLSNAQSVILYEDKAYPVSSITFTLEGFADNDASFAVQTASTNLNKKGSATDVRRTLVNPPRACPDGYFRASHDVCCPDGTAFDGHHGCNQPDVPDATPTPVPAEHAAEPHHRKCDKNSDCPGFANSCFAGNCEAEDTGQCNSNADCPGFANSCFAGHCESKDTNQCNSNADCHGFANSCFAGHCTNP